MVYISKLLKSISGLDALLFFLERPDQKYYKEQLIKELGKSKVTVNKNIDRLADMNLLNSEQIGKTILYQLNKNHPAVKQLKIFVMISKITELVPKLNNTEVYVYGSVARGEDTEKSDIDMIFIGSENRSKIIEECTKMEKIMKKHINPIIFSENELLKLAKNDSSFYEKIIRERIKVYPWT